MLTDRRRVLASVLAVAGVAGCARRQSGGTGTTPGESTTARTTARATLTVDGTPLSATAAAAGPTADRPPVLDLGVTNEGDDPVPLSSRGEGGYPLEYVPAAESSLLLVPVDPESVSLFGASVPDGRRDGCWRAPEGADVAVENFPFAVELDPGATYAVRQRVFWRGPAGTCFGPARLEWTAPLELAGEMESGPAIELSYALSVEDGAFSVAVS